MKFQDVRLILIVGIMTGTYPAIFYVMSNLTMLPFSSALVVWAVLTIPVTIGVGLLYGGLNWLRLNWLAIPACLFFAVGYLLVVLREPVFDLEFVKNVRSNLDGIAWLFAHLVLFAAPAALIAFLFRHYPAKYAVVLGVMSLSAVFLGAISRPVNDLEWRDERVSTSSSYLHSLDLVHRPNIYLILSDGMGSLAYMHEKNIDTTGLERALKKMDFRAYKNIFSNYHATLASMLAILDMEHHYYLSTFKGDEVGRAAREIIGGRNNLVRLLKQNDYWTEYIHQGNYLLLQGCSADFCFPNPSSLTAANNVFREIIPGRIAGYFSATASKWQSLPPEDVSKLVVKRTEVTSESGTPYFRYVHFYQPGHAGNDVMGVCDEVVETQQYGSRVAGISGGLTELIGRIIAIDPKAVIVLTGDHGPFISQNCDRTLDVDEPSEYRDRVGTFLAIRWPESYDGKFDAEIKTSVNIFRYVLASLAADADQVLRTVVEDDVYVQGRSGVLQVLDDGAAIVPPRKFKPEQVN